MYNKLTDLDNKMEKLKIFLQNNYQVGLIPIVKKEYKISKISTENFSTHNYLKKSSEPINYKSDFIYLKLFIKWIYSLHFFLLSQHSHFFFG